MKDAAEIPRRWLGAWEGECPGPTMVVLGGVHGNEQSGVLAIERVLQELRRRKLSIRGRLLGLAGNRHALAHGVRYVSRDLNRRWYPEQIAHLREQPRERDSVEDGEQRELLHIFDRLDERFDHPLVILDLHSFSAEGPPFSVLADTLHNRAVAYELRVPIILGLEEAVDGTLLGYLADRGHIALGFEAGQHEDPRTVDNHVAAIWVTMVAAGLLRRVDVPELANYEEVLEQAGAGFPRAVEIVHRHAIAAADGFRMDPGYVNFQAIRKGQRLAVDSEGEIGAPMSGRILMPLYQGLGEDGFFLARDLGEAHLQLSAALRKLRVDGLLPWLPGVEWDERAPDEVLLAGERPAIQELLRMLGYRKQTGERRLARRRQEVSQRRGRGGGVPFDEG